MKVIVVAGTQAGSGKTTVAVGLMAALRQRGLRVQAFKVGPDPLDPLLHEAATGRPSYTLDGWMLSREYNLTRVARVADSADIAVVEGGETLFDGPDGDERGSAAHVAKTLGAPVLLVLDCAAHSARSAAAVLKGSLALDEELAVAGVVLNKTKSRAHEESFRATLAGPSPKTALRGVPILGAIRRDDAHAGALRDGGFGGRGPSGFAAAAAKAALALRAGGARSVGGGRSADGGQKNPREQQSESFVAGVAAQLARVVGDGVDLNALVDAAWEFVVDETGPGPAAAAEADRGDANANANASDHPAGPGPDAGDASGAGAPPHASSTPSTPSKQDSFGGKDLGAFPAIPESPQSREKGGKPPTSADHPGSQSRKNSIGRHLVTSVASKIGNHLPRPLLFPGVSRGDAPVRVAVALDAAFCHYYRENLALLEAAGAHLVTFSPIAGDSIPESCKGVYFGGGYQELYASELSANRPLRAATAAFASHGGVTYAECGAVAFLSRALADGGATPRPMCGLAPFDTRVVLSEAGSGSSVGSSSFSAAAGAARSGYVEAAVLEGCPIFPAGARCRGYVHRNSEVVGEPVLGEGPRDARDEAKERGSSPAGSGWFAAYDARRGGFGFDAAAERSSEPSEPSEPESPSSPSAGPSAAGPDRYLDRSARGYAWKNAVVSYARLHFGDAPEFAQAFVDACRGAPSAAAEAALKAETAARKLPQLAGQGPGSAPSLPHLSPYTAANNDGSSESLTQLAASAESLASLASLEPSSVPSTIPGSDARTRGHRRAQSEEFPEFSSPSSLSLGTGAGALAPLAAARAGESLSRMSKSKSSGGLHALGPDSAIRGGGGGAGGVGGGMHKSASASGGFRGSFGLSHSAAGSRGGSSAALSEFVDDEALLSFPPASGPMFDQRDLAAGGYEASDADHLHSPAATPQPPPAPSCSVASLTPAATEIAHALGLQARLVCVTDRCDYPPTVARSFPIVLRSRGDGGGSGGGNDRRGRQGSGAGIGARRASISTAMHRAGVDANGAGGRDGCVSVDVEWLRRARPGLILAQDACERCVGGAHDGVVPRALRRAGVLGGGRDRDRGGGFHGHHHPFAADASESGSTTGGGGGFSSGGSSPTHSPSAGGDAASQARRTRVLAMDPQRLSEVFDVIAQVGAATGVPERAEALVESLRARLRRVARAIAGAAAIARPKVLSLEGLRPLAVGGHWLPEMKHVAGGRDELQDPGAPAVGVRWEQVLRYAPEVLVLAPCVSQTPEDTLGELERLAAQPGWWAIPAVRDRRVFVADHAMFSRAGPRLVDGVEALAKMIHPEAAPDVKSRQGFETLKMRLEPGKQCRPRQLRSHFHPWGGGGERRVGVRSRSGGGGRRRRRGRRRGRRGVVTRLIRVGGVS